MDSKNSCRWQLALALHVVLLTAAIGLMAFIFLPRLRLRELTLPKLEERFVPLVIALAVVVAGIVYAAYAWRKRAWRAYEDMVEPALRRAQYTSALETLQQLRRRYPEERELSVAHGRLLLWAGEHNDAVHLSQREAAQRSERHRYLHLTNWGLALLALGREHEAGQVLTRAAHLGGPAAIEALSGLTEYYITQGTYPERVLKLTEQILLTPRVPVLEESLAWANRAWAFAKLSRDVEAGSALEHAFNICDRAFTPGMAALYYKAGQTMETLTEYEEAVRYYTYARRIDPEGHFGRQAAWQLRSLAAAQEKRTFFR